MATVSTTRVSGLLKRTELFSEEQLFALIEEAKENDASITEIATKAGLVKEEDFLKALSEVLKLPFVHIVSEEVEPEILQKLPTKVVFQHNVIPFSAENGTLTVCTNDPLNAGLLDTLRLASGTRVKLALSTSVDIAKAAKDLYGVGADTLDKMMQDDDGSNLQELTIEKIDLSELDQEASIVKFVNQIIWEACQQGATDIHMEPMETSLRIRYRVDGVLHQTPVPPQLNRFQAAIISRIKVMANMDIAEKRLPMDGRIGLRVQGEGIDIRVSTMPTVYGESISLRILQKKGEFIGLEDLGMCKRDSGLIEKIIHKPNGIVLVTGPTGSGKSTSLYAYLYEINTMDQRILTAEEPIEYEMPGINQVLVRPEIGLTFAKSLRSFLRQDPDIIMVGEIRDFETADIAIQASLTGHLVFSTLHTNDSAGAFTRLLDMGVEPYLAASAVEAVVAQRLVRKLCPDCRTPIKPEAKFMKEISFPIDKLKDHEIYDLNGCEKCRSTGFRGRMGIFEVLNVTESIESLVISRRPTNEIKQKSISQGMQTLRDDGWTKVLNGLTTVEEVLRVSEENE